MGTAEEHAREALSAELGAMRATVEAQGRREELLDGGADQLRDLRDDRTRDLYQDVPEIPQLLRRERPYRPTNVAGV